MKRFRDYITESTKPKYEELLNQAKHHAGEEQKTSDVAGVYTPGARRDVTAHEPTDHSHEKMKVIGLIAQHYPNKLSHAMSAINRHVSGD
jgi:hypothetical protein